MRTTVTLDADTEALVRRRMAERGVSFKQALNDAIRAGATTQGGEAASVTRVRHMGQPMRDLDKALQLAAEIEDDELTRKMQTGK